MSIEQDLELIKQHWGSENSLNVFLDAEVRRLCPLICGSDAPLPRVQLVPTFMEGGLLGGTRRGGEYEPHDGNFPATVSILPSMATDKASVTRVLAHELVHHWEHLRARGVSALTYPAHADGVIAARFRHSGRESRWRGGHSRDFIAKLHAVGQTLGEDLRELLFS